MEYFFGLKGISAPALRAFLAISLEFVVTTTFPILSDFEILIFTIRDKFPIFEIFIFNPG